MAGPSELHITSGQPPLLVMVLKMKPPRRGCRRGTLSLFDLAKPDCGFHPENHNSEGGRDTGVARRRLQDWTMSDDAVVAGPDKNQSWGFHPHPPQAPTADLRADHCQRPPQPSARSMSTCSTTTAAPNDQDHQPEDHLNQIWLLLTTGYPLKVLNYTIYRCIRNIMSNMC
jgi:hypothetical protein